jgi:UDP-N-acetylmuramate--alanine ligase
VEHIQELPQLLRDILQDGDVLLTLGAGDIGAVAARLADELQAVGGSDD